MINILRRHRRSTRRGLVAVVAAALLAPLMVAQPAGAGPAIVGTAGDLAAAATTTIEDHSMAMPRASGNEVTGDFLGLGYDQRAVIEGDAQATNLNIYDRDGTILKSHPTPLPNLAGISDWVQPAVRELGRRGQQIQCVRQAPAGLWPTYAPQRRRSLGS